MCFFRNIKRVTNFLDMSMIGTTDLIDTAKTPTCSYTIRSGGPDGPPIRSVGTHFNFEPDGFSKFTMHFLLRI